VVTAISSSETEAGSAPDEPPITLKVRLSAMDLWLGASGPALGILFDTTCF
jgi:hypothetical protein